MRKLNALFIISTLSGISPIKPGDLIEATIEKIGTLSNPVILEGEK